MNDEFNNRKCIRIRFVDSMWSPKAIID